MRPRNSTSDVDQEEFEFDYDHYADEDPQELDFEYEFTLKDEQDLTQWMDSRDEYDFSNRGLNSEDISDLIGSQILTIEELESWKKEDNCE